jgi:hypothetical protein
MRKRFIAALAVSALAVVALAIPNASAVSSKFDWHVSDAFIQSGTGLTQTGAQAAADNGDLARVSGHGTFNMSSGKATGGGIFAHTDADGELLGFGTWKAMGVHHFTFYGCGGEGLPSNFCGGELVLDVRLSGVSVSLGPGEFDGILTVFCLIGDFPEDVEEGVTLEIPGLINFDEILGPADVGPSGLTVFVSRNRS